MTNSSTDAQPGPHPLLRHRTESAVFTARFVGANAAAVPKQTKAGAEFVRPGAQSQARTEGPTRPPAWTEGYAEGVAEGRARAATEAAAAAAAAAARLATRLEEAFAASLEDQRQHAEEGIAAVARLVFDVVERMLPDADPEAAVAFVRAMAARMAEDRRIVVRAAADVAPLLQVARGRIGDWRARLVVTSDAALPTGEVRLIWRGGEAVRAPAAARAELLALLRGIDRAVPFDTDLPARHTLAAMTE